MHKSGTKIYYDVYTVAKKSIEVPYKKKTTYAIQCAMHYKKQEMNYKKNIPCAIIPWVYRCGINPYAYLWVLVIPSYVHR
jgi:hypothetical protein